MVDASSRFDGNFGGAPHYRLNSVGESVDDASVKEPLLKISGDADRYDHRAGNGIASEWAAECEVR